MRKFSLLVFVLVCTLNTSASAHRSGCHRWHSCPSDTGSYVCGDLGYTSGCGTERVTLVSIPAMPDVAAGPPVAGATRRTSTNVNLRQGPQAASAKLALLPKGTVVGLMGCGAGWCQVTTRGRTGYVAQQYLR